MAESRVELTFSDPGAGAASRRQLMLLVGAGAAATLLCTALVLLFCFCRCPEKISQPIVWFIGKYQTHPLVVWLRQLYLPFTFAILFPLRKASGATWEP